MVGGENVQNLRIYLRKNKQLIDKEDGQNGNMKRILIYDNHYKLKKVDKSRFSSTVYCRLKKRQVLPSILKSQMLSNGGSKIKTSSGRIWYGSTTECQQNSIWITNNIKVGAVKTQVEEKRVGIIQRCLERLVWLRQGIQNEVAQSPAHQTKKPSSSEPGDELLRHTFQADSECLREIDQVIGVAELSSLSMVPQSMMLGQFANPADGRDGHSSTADRATDPSRSRAVKRSD
ncbi:hypothetical protein K438DRAFT_1750303 [Mycena galopus ATCC 62051]|nr:hypothetical protein K438DRAFT_1750303 [Mycena galopus ATCC 62051]